MSTTLYAYLSRYSLLKASDLSTATPDQLAKGLTFSGYDNWAKDDGEFLLVGTAQVEITLYERDKIIGTQIAARRQRQAEVQARAQREATEIEHQINSLLAIEGAAKVVV